MTEHESWVIFLRGFGLALRKRPQPYICQQCGRRFRRRNLIETWERSAAGAWEKRIVKICTTCHTFGARLRLVRRAG